MADKMDFRAPVPDNVLEILRGTGEVIGNALPSGWGFALMIFTYGENGTMSWISSADRADMIRVMDEFKVMLSEQPAARH